MNASDLHSFPITPHSHFLAEAYLPALKALSLVSPQLDDVPKRVLFPRCTDAGNLQGWKDAKGLSACCLSFLYHIHLLLKRSGRVEMYRHPSICS